MSPDGSEPAGVAEPAAATPHMSEGQAVWGRPRRSLWRRFGPFTILGFLLIVVGALGLTSDMMLPWTANTAEREVPILGLINEGAPWVDLYRDDLIEAYADRSFYAQGFLLWSFLGWTTTMLAGGILVLTSTMRKWPTARTNTRAITLAGHAGFAFMMLVTVSRRLGREVLDRTYNDVHYYRWSEATYVQGAGALLGLAISGYLLWRMYQERPFVAVRAHDTDPYAVPLHLFGLSLVAVTLLVSPWIPWAELIRRAIVGNAWMGEGNLISYALSTSDEAVVVAGLGWLGALRAIYVASWLAVLSIFGILWWRQARSRVGRWMGAALANAYLFAIGPLLLGANAYDIYVRVIARQSNYILLHNQFHGVLIAALVLVWVAHVMMVSVPILRARPRRAQAPSGAETEPANPAFAPPE